MGALAGIGIMVVNLIPKILLHFLGVIVTQKFLSELIEDAVVFLLRKGAKLTVTTYDDDKVEKIVKLLNEDKSD